MDFSHLVTTGGRGHELYRAVLSNSAEISRFILAFGPRGTQKTSTAVRAAERSGLPVFMFTATRDVPMSELRGRAIPNLTTGGENWSDGIAMRPFRSGGTLIVNEITRLSDEGLSFLYGICDGNGIARITLPTGETVKQHPSFRLIATDNVGPSDIPDALADRFSGGMIYVAEPAPEAVESLSHDIRAQCVEGYRNAIGGEPRTTFREWQAFDALRRVHGEAMAAELVFGAVRGAEIANALAVAAL